MKRKWLMGVTVVVLSLGVLTACGTKEEGKKDTKNSETSRQTTILPKGTYLYQSSDEYVKIDVLSDTEWNVSTEETNYPEKVTVKDTGKKMDGYKLYHFSSEGGKKINGHGVFTIFKDEGTDYFIVKEDNKVTFVLNIDTDKTGKFDVKKRAKENENRDEILIKQ